MKNIENHTVYFDDNNIKTLYKASLAFKILRKNISKATESPNDYMIELPVANLTTDDLKQALRSRFSKPKKFTDVSFGL